MWFIWNPFQKFQFLDLFVRWEAEIIEDVVSSNVSYILGFLKSPLNGLK